MNPKKSNRAHAVLLPRKVHPIYSAPHGAKSWTDVLMKAALDENTKSAQGRSTGRKQHPFNMRQAARFMLSNSHHAAAIMARRNSTTGLGYLSPLDQALRQNEKRARLGLPALVPDESLVLQTRSKVATVLNPLCSISFQDLMDHIGEDLSNTHNGYMEVVRREGDGITSTPTGLHHIPAHEAFVFVETRQQDRHFEILNGNAVGGSLRFPRYGDKARFMASTYGKSRKANEVSEIIQFRFPSSMSRDYGIPTWISSLAAIELVQALHQHEFDFYNNRGVPEFLLFLLGQRLDDAEWDAIKAVFEAGVGLGNTHKSGAFNIDGADVKVQLEKLALEGKSDGRFPEMSTALALEIITGHRIPPLLAGITIPGKLGASNELPNALMAYQTLTIAPDQATIQATLGHTLGRDEVNGHLGLTFDDFEAKTILDVMDLSKMNTVASMKQTLPEAQAQGRNLDAGLKKSDDPVLNLLRSSDPADLLGDVIVALLERAAAAA